MSITERNLLSCSVRLGEMGLVNPIVASSDAFRGSLKLTSPLVALIKSQDVNATMDCSITAKLRREIHQFNRTQQTLAAKFLHSNFSPILLHCVEIAVEKGSSSWLSAIPVDSHGFYLNKGEFRDALCLRYGWALPSIPGKCHCGKPFSVDHFVVCSTGGFPTIRHNEVHDLTAQLLTEVCPSVSVEPPLQSFE